VRQVRIRSLVTSALLVALLAASAWITVPLGTVPATLQTLVVILIALLCTPAQAAATVGAYVLLGAAGVPVFSSAQGGVATLVGPTGGYLLGFLLGASAGAAVLRLADARQRTENVPVKAGVAGSFSESTVETVRPVRVARRPRPPRNVRADGLAAATTLVIVYALGTLWLAASSGLALGQAVVAGVLPFVLLDALKAGAAVAAAGALRRAGVA